MQGTKGKRQKARGKWQNAKHIDLLNKVQGIKLKKVFFTEGASFATCPFPFAFLEKKWMKFDFTERIKFKGRRGDFNEIKSTSKRFDEL